MRLAERVEHRAVLRRSARRAPRTGSVGQRRRYRWRGCRAAIVPHCAASVGRAGVVLGVAQDAARDRLALDAVHHEPAAEPVVGLEQQQHGAAPRTPAAAAAASSAYSVARSSAPPWRAGIAPQHEPVRARRPRSIASKRPRLPRRAARAAAAAPRPAARPTNRPSARASGSGSGASRATAPTLSGRAPQRRATRAAPSAPFLHRPVATPPRHVFILRL